MNLKFKNKLEHCEIFCTDMKLHFQRLESIFFTIRCKTFLTKKDKAEIYEALLTIESHGSENMINLAKDINEMIEKEDL